MKYDIKAAVKADAEMKKAMLESDRARLNDLYQGKEAEIIVKNYLDGKDVVQNIPIEYLIDNEKNHFSKIENEKWEDFVGSIKEYGVITPLLVRKIGMDTYEILAGHNRKNAAIKAGLSVVPCIVKDLDDVDASVIIGISNNQREETSDLEWGWAYRNTYELLKKDKGRPKTEKGFHDGTFSEDEKGFHDGTFSEKERKGQKTFEIVAKKYGIGVGTVQRKIRLTYLTDGLYEALMNAKITQTIMVDLSYLSQLDQNNLIEKVTWDKKVIDEEIAKTLKNKAQELNGADIGIDELDRIINSFNKGDNKLPSRPRRYKIEDDYFPADIKKGEREDYIRKALIYISENNIDLGIDKAE